jgi:hypothetical protein
MRIRFRHRIRLLGFGLCLTVFVFMLEAIATTSIGFQCQTAQAQLETLPPSLPPMNLTVIGLNGTEVVLNSTDIASLPSIRGLGGFRPSIVDNYTGVPLTNLCNLVGGIGNDSVVRITGSDNYSQTFSYDQIVNGNLTTYDPTTGNIVPHSEPLTLIIAYYKDDANLTNQGPLMVAIIGPEGLGTAGKLWVYYVTEIQILNETAIPEFQLFSVTLFLLATAVAAMILLKNARPQTKGRARALQTLHWFS